MFLRSYARLSSLDACQNEPLCSTFSAVWAVSASPGRWDRYGIFLRPRHSEPEASTGRFLRLRATRSEFAKIAKSTVPWKEARTGLARHGTSLPFYRPRSAGARELKRRGRRVWRRLDISGRNPLFVRKLLAQAQLLVLPTHPRETEATTLSVDKTTKLEMLDTSAPARSRRNWKLERR